MRQLTLEHTPNDLLRGDLLLMPGKGISFFVIYLGHSKTRKTMKLLDLKINLNAEWNAERIKLGKIDSCGWDKANILMLNDKPFCQPLTSPYFLYTQEYIPYPVSLLPVFLQDKYNQILALL